MTGDILPDECDFCGQILEEDEDLHPVWVGEQPDPKPVFARATAKKDRRVMGRDTRRRDAVRERPDLEVLGRPMGQVVALMEALGRSDAIEVDYKDAVRELRAVGSETPDKLVDMSAPADEKLQRTLEQVKKDPNHIPTFTGEEDHDKVGVEIRVEPEVERPDPDMEVCEFCKESFEGDD
jgi:exoribonuclease R